MPGIDGASLKDLTKGAVSVSRRCRTGCALIMVHRSLRASLSSALPAAFGGSCSVAAFMLCTPHPWVILHAAIS